MKLWHALFIGTYILAYGSLAAVLLGSLIWDVTKALHRSPRRTPGRPGTRRVVIGVTVLATSVAGFLIIRGSGFLP